MIEELEKKDFHKVENLFNERIFINCFRSHLEKTPVPKQVFVDDIKNPQTAVFIVMPRLFFGGRADNKEFNKELRKILYEELVIKFKEKEFMDIDCYLSNNEWEEGVKAVLKDPHPYDRYYYEIKKLKLENWRELIPEGFSIEPVDLTVLEKDYLKNYSWLWRK